MEPSAEQVRRAGLRVTRPRRAILEWLTDHPHSTADQVHGGVVPILGSLSVQATYDVLAAFADAGLVRRIQPAGHPARFECRTGDNHHHIVCRGCGVTADVDCVVGEPPCLAPVPDRDFVVDEAEIVFWGWCPACRRTGSTVPDRASTTYEAATTPEEAAP